MRKKLMLNLQLFAEGGAEGVGEASETAGATELNAADNATVAESQAENGQLAIDNEDFESLIKGKYKEDYEKRVKSAIDKRFKTAKKAENELNSLAPFLKTVKERYHLPDDADVNSISKAFEEDDLYLQNLSMTTGKSTDELKSEIQKEREKNMAVFAAQTAQEELKALREAEENRQKVAKWGSELENLKEQYPWLDVVETLKDKDFFGLVNYGIPVEHAFKVLNQDKILGGAMQYTAEQVKKATVNNIAAGRNRPSENGTSSSAASKSEFDVNNLTDTDILKILKEVENGKKITF